MGFWDKWAAFYDFSESFNRRAYKAMLNGVRAVVPEGAKVLDCAAGTGELSIAAAEKAESVLCTDLSLSMLEVAKGKCQTTTPHQARRQLSMSLSWEILGFFHRGKEMVGLLSGLLEEI